jgi:transposase-like protein
MNTNPIAGGQDSGYVMGRTSEYERLQRLRIVKEGKKTGVKAVCAKYRISDQSYRLWRYKVRGIQPRRHFSVEEKLRILEDGCQNGVLKVCAAYRIDPTTYYYWKRQFGFTKSPRIPGRPRRFTDEEKLVIVEEGERTSVKAVCEKYGFCPKSYRLWRYKVRGIQPRRHFSVEEKLRILEDGCQNGVLKVCAAYRIDPTTYYYWKRQLGFTRSSRHSPLKKPGPRCPLGKRVR